MAVCFRSLVATCIGFLVTASAVAQERTVDDEPDTMTAMNFYMRDGTAMFLARSCNESIPDFMSEFLPRFTNWRAAHWKHIALGRSLSAQFKDPNGAPMDLDVAGKAIAQQLRAMPPAARRQECSNLLQDFSSAEDGSRRR